LKKITFKSLAAICLAITFVYFYLTAVAKTVDGGAEKDGAVIIGAFRNTGAGFKKMDLQGWSQLNNRYSTKDELHNTGSLVLTGLGADTLQLKSSEHINDNFISVTKSGWLDRQTYLTVITQTMREKGGRQKGETYLIVGFSHFGTPENYRLLRNKITGVFAPIKTEAHFSTIISGTVPKKIDAAEMQNLTKKVMEKAGAKIVENYADARMASISGFTPEIGDRLTLGQKRVNINMAVRYDSVDKNTRVYIGSPIITTEY
jgi:hypothetical protein